MTTKLLRCLTWSVSADRSADTAIAYRGRATYDMLHITITLRNPLSYEEMIGVMCLDQMTPQGAVCWLQEAATGKCVQVVLGVRRTQASWKLLAHYAQPGIVCQICLGRLLCL